MKLLMQAVLNDDVVGGSRYDTRFITVPGGELAEPNGNQLGLF